MDDIEIFYINDERFVPDIVHNYSSQWEGLPLIIDNGSYTCRVGWESDKNPKISFRNCYARQRKDRGKKTQGGALESEILVANDIINIEAVRFQLKSQFDENVVTHFEAQEIMLDYIFSHLGIDTASVAHPVIMTEAFCNPNYSRQCMSELLFECYGIPKITYCVDGLLSYHYNCKKKDGIVVNFGNCTTHIMPIIDHVVDSSKSRRIRVGGQHLVRYLWRWLQLKYPQHLNAITLSRVEKILYSNSHISEDFMTEISKWADAEYFDKNVRKIQLPFSVQPTTSLSSEQLKERKKEAAKRLAYMNAKRRQEKLEEDETELARLIELEEAMEEFTPDEAEYQHALDEAHVHSLQELQRKSHLLEQRIEKTKLKMAQAVKEDESDAGIVPEPKQKKVCLLAPSNQEEREMWLQQMKHQWNEIQMRKTARRNRRLEMAKRRTAASQERMRIISLLAKRETKEDNFGMNDDDWDVYKTINKDGGGSDSEEDDEKLQDIEGTLKHHCPEFLGNSSHSKPTSFAENYQLLFGAEQNPELDPWHGAQKMAAYLLKHGVTKQEYEEFGGSFLKEHKAGNRYWAPVTTSESADLTSQPFIFGE